MYFFFSDHFLKAHYQSIKLTCDNVILFLCHKSNYTSHILLSTFMDQNYSKHKINGRKEGYNRANTLDSGKPSKALRG